VSVSVGEPSHKKRNRGIAIVQGPATTLPAKGIAKNCLIVIFATAVALALAMPSVSPATNSGDGFNK
jgi:hypothetical protein